MCCTFACSFDHATNTTLWIVHKWAVQQIQPLGQALHLGRQVTRVAKSPGQGDEPAHWIVLDDQGSTHAARCLVLAAGAGALLHQDLVAVMHQLGDRRRHQADAVLVVLDLGGNADAHVQDSFGSAVAAVLASLQQVAGAFGLGPEIVFVMPVGRKSMGDAFGDFDAVALEL